MILLVAVIVLVNLPGPLSTGIKNTVREAIAPLQEVVTGTAGRISRQITAIPRYPQLPGEVDRLKREINRLEVENMELRTFDAENSRLREQLGYQPRSRWPLVACDVIGRTQDGWWQTITINKGRDDGIEPGMAVVTREGLVGKTVEASDSAAKVLLLADPSCRVSARFAGARVFGIVAGRGPSWRGQIVCRMDFINKSVPVAPGDEVVTSGLGGVFPPDIPVGHVDRVYSDPSGLYQYADIVARADLGALEDVYVVTFRPRQEAVP